MSRSAVTLKPAGDETGQLRRGGLLPVFAAAVLAVCAILVWRLADVLLLAFGAVLVAILLDALARPLATRAKLPRAVALTASAGGLLLVACGSLWLFGQQIAIQIGALANLLPSAWRAISAELAALGLDDGWLVGADRLRDGEAFLIGTATDLLRRSASGMAALVIVLFAGVYLAFHPQTYLGGTLRLLPGRVRPRAAQVLAAVAEALRRWMLGQLASMLLVGVSVALGLWGAGTPSPLALGLLAGLAQFIPVVGPMAAVAPGLIVAASAGPQTLAWTAVTYVVASQAEANVVAPLLLRQMVDLPMAVTLFAVLTMGVLLGPLGVLFATPLAVVASVLVRRVYIEGLLGEACTATVTEVLP